MNLLVCLLVIAITGTLVIKKFKAQTVLLLGGLIMRFFSLMLLNILTLRLPKTRQTLVS